MERVNTSKRRNQESWADVMTKNDYQIARILLKHYNEGNYTALGEGLKALLDNARVNAELELYTALRELMVHIIHALYGPGDNPQEVWEAILHYRRIIEDLKQEYEFIHDAFIQKEWDESFESAWDIASHQISGQEFPDNLTYEDVFVRNFAPQKSE